MSIYVKFEDGYQMIKVYLESISLDFDLLIKRHGKILELTIDT